MNKQIRKIAILTLTMIASLATAIEASKVKYCILNNTNDVNRYYGGSNIVNAIMTANYEVNAVCEIALTNHNVVIFNQAIQDAAAPEKFDYIIEMIRYFNKMPNLAGLLVSSYKDMNEDLTADQWNTLIEMTNDFDSVTTDGMTVDIMIGRNILKNRRVVSSNRGDKRYYDLQSVLAILLDGGLNKSITDIEQAKHYIVDIIVPQIKVNLRTTGKTFVSLKDDSGNIISNPIEDCAKPIIDALNAPVCAGLEQALTAIGLSVQTVDRTRLTNSVPTYANSIMFGDVSFSNTGSIAVLLGVTNYNAWVKRYNEGD